MLQTSVEIVNPGGTGNPALVISARPAPLPPSRSFISRLPSALPLPKKYTYFPRLFRAARTGVRALVFEVPTFDGFTAVFIGIEFSRALGSQNRNVCQLGDSVSQLCEQR